MESRCEIRRELVLPPAPCENDVRMRYNVRLSLDFRTVPKIDMSVSGIYDYMNGDIAVGSTVRYAGTGSVGEVNRLEERDHELWVHLDSTGLWYATATLEVLGLEFGVKGRGRTLSPEKKEWGRKLSLEELKKMEERKIEDISRVQEITSSISAGVFG